ncbi:MAG: tail fiber protein [Fluviicola sp.]|nr:tail fiber protein [Fluviicola sp.]
MEGVIGFTTLFAGNFAPKSWAFCQGQTINIASNTALFSILGTQYGGNGTTTFMLPDLQGRTMVGAGTGPGLSTYNIGQKSGVENASMTTSNMPAHMHPVTAQLNISATGNPANTASPIGNLYAVEQGSELIYGLDGNVQMAKINGNITMTNTGAGAPFEILRPLLGLNYIICQYGVFPARN